MDEVVRWIIGGLVGIYTAVTGYVVHLNNRNGFEINKLNIRLAVLEARPHVDPLEYTKVIADFTNTIKLLNTTISDLQDQIAELEDLIRNQKQGLVR